MITIDNGLVSQDMLNAATAAARAMLVIVIGLEKAVKLLDVPQTAQPFLDFFFRRGALVGDDLLGFLFQHVDDEFVDGLVSSGIRTLLDLLQQFAFDLYFV